MYAFNSILLIIILAVMIIAAFLIWYVALKLWHKLQLMEESEKKILDALDLPARALLHFRGTAIELYGSKESVQALYTMLEIIQEDAKNVYQEGHSEGKVH